MPYKIATFGVNEMMACRGRLRSLFDDDPGSIASAAQRVVDFFRDEFVDEHGASASALVRFFKTERFAALDGDQQEFALKRQAPLRSTTTCVA